MANVSIHARVERDGSFKEFHLSWVPKQEQMAEVVDVIGQYYSNRINFQEAALEITKIVDKPTRKPTTRNTASKTEVNHGETGSVYDI